MTTKKSKRNKLLDKFKRKFGRNRAILNDSDPGNDKYRRNHVKVVQK